MVPADVETRRYGQVDQDTLQAARTALAQARAAGAAWRRPISILPAARTSRSLQDVAAHVDA
jgi:chemosensory pili system protein ChpA (sensor histidine kinase/response regulator)